jgi:hypothetical protein
MVHQTAFEVERTVGGVLILKLEEGRDAGVRFDVFQAARNVGVGFECCRSATDARFLFLRKGTLRLSG